ncbi:MAG: DUF5069 domain-containing protein [Opitutales bacterium]
MALSRSPRYATRMASSPDLPLALDLTKDFPRSPRQTLAGYVIAARTLDKCRAELAGSAGEYHFDCPLDNIFFAFVDVRADDFKAFVATGADDEAVAKWIEDHAQKRARAEIVQFNNEWRGKHLYPLPTKMQLFMEDYIPKNLPTGRVVHHFFDIYDIEEKRM